MCKNLVVLALVLGMVSTSYSDIIVGNWEWSLDGWNTDSAEGEPQGQGYTSFDGYSPIGATLDSRSLMVRTGPGNGDDYWKIASPVVAVPNLMGGKFKLDVSLRVNEWDVNGWFQLDSLAFSTNVGIDGVPFTDSRQVINHYQDPENPGTWLSTGSVTVTDRDTGVTSLNTAWGPWLGDVNWTYTWDLSNMKLRTWTGGEWPEFSDIDWTGVNQVRIFVSMQQPNIPVEDAGYVYLDNARLLVPEPASALIMALGATIISLHRRKC
jgi:hypothetical protein